MKKILLLLAALLAPAALSAASFEGKITMKMTGLKNPPASTIFSVKEGFSRMELGGGSAANAAVIIDAAKQEMTILMLDQKMYMTQALPKPQASASGAGGGPGETASVEVTTSHEKILGYDCVKYVTKTRDGTTEAWVTDQLGSFLGLGAPTGGGRRGPGVGAPAPQGWEEALAGRNVFPLRVVTTKDGKEAFRLEATAVEPMTIPAGAFSAPADFKNLSDMLRGMGMPSGIPGMPGGMKLPGGE